MWVTGETDIHKFRDNPVEASTSQHGLASLENPNRRLPRIVQKPCEREYE